MFRMYRIKHVSQLGSDIAYNIEYKTIFKTYDINIYYDKALNIWNGTMTEGTTYYDIGSDKAGLIISELLTQTYLKGIDEYV